MFRIFVIMKNISSPSFLIGELVKSDRKLLFESVKNLTIVLKNHLPEDEYFKILHDQQNREFWKMDNLRNFYDFYLQLWDEKRISKLN